MTLNDRSTALSLLQTRRSGRPRELVGPGPNQDQLRSMLEIACRTPDHGGLAPYRFVIVEPGQREALASLYAEALREAEPDVPEAKIAKAIANAHAAPTLIVLISAPIEGHKIPVFEQELTCGAAGMNLLHAVTAMGFVGGWITGWPATNAMVVKQFCEPGQRVAGLIYIGQPSMPLEERVRPKLESIVTTWNPVQD